MEFEYYPFERTDLRIVICDTLVRRELASSEYNVRRGRYEASSPELNILVDAAAGVPGILGARMMGAGFGGCTINLVEDAAVEGFRGRVGREDQGAIGREPKIHVVRIEAGTRLVTGR